MYHNHRREHVKPTLKLGAAFVFAFICANILSYFYYFSAKAITNWEGYTTSKHQVNLKHNFYGVEGFGITSMDSNGFNNDGTVQPAETNIICIGSSQTEALQVNTSYNYVSTLNKLETGFKAYNLGVSAQFLNKSLYRLPLIPQYFSSCKIIVAETPWFPTLTETEEIIKILETDDVPINDLDWKDKQLLMKVYRSLPLASVMNRQVSLLRKVDSTMNSPQSIEQEDLNVYEKKFGYALHLLRQKLKDIPILFVYLPKFQMERSGQITFIKEKKECVIRKVCSENNIVFISMEPSFYDAYEKYRVLPYGFRNSAVGKGHLNENGHRLVALKLASTIREKGWLQ